MDDKSALIVLTGMHVTATTDVAFLEKKLAKENAEFEKDPDPLTARIIELTAAKVTRRRLEAEALEAAVAKFEKVL